MEKKMKVKILSYIKKHRILISAILMVIALAAIFLPQIILKLPIVTREKITGIEVTVFCSQIVSAIFVIAGTVIAVWQYYLSSSKRMKEVEFSRVEKAIELSNYYKDNILGRYSFVKRVFDCCGISEMIESKRKSCELRDFDIIELREIYTKEEIERFENLPSDNNFIDAIIKMSSVYNIDIKGCSRNIENNTEGNKATMKILANPIEIFNDFFKTYIVQMLNNAEYFAMSFTHNTADESVIYQSIYPTFLEMCFIMYYYIAKNSDPSESKLYTNIAQLYCEWRKRQVEQIQEYQIATRKGSKKTGTVIEIEK